MTHGVAPQVVVSLAKTPTVPSSGAITATVQASGSPVTDAGLVLKLYGTWKGTSHLLGTASRRAARCGSHSTFRRGSPGRRSSCE